MMAKNEKCIEPTLWSALGQDFPDEVFSGVYEETSHAVWTLCFRVLKSQEDASDGFQGAYARLIQMVRNEPHPPEGHSIETLMLRLAVLESDRLRKQRGRRQNKEVAVEQIDRINENSLSLEDLLAQQQLREKLTQLIDQLPDNLRLPVVLHYIDGFTQTQIAASLGVSQSVISDRLKKALGILRPKCQSAGLRELSTVLTATAGLQTLLAPPSAMAATTVLSSAIQISQSAGFASLSLSALMPAKGAVLGGKALLATVASVIIALIIFASFFTDLKFNQVDKDEERAGTVQPSKKKPTLKMGKGITYDPDKLWVGKEIPEETLNSKPYKDLKDLLNKDVPICAVHFGQRIHVYNLSGRWRPMTLSILKDKDTVIRTVRFDLPPTGVVQAPSLFIDGETSPTVTLCMTEPNFFPEGSTRDWSLVKDFKHHDRQIGIPSDPFTTESVLERGWGIHQHHSNTNKGKDTTITKDVHYSGISSNTKAIHIRNWYSVMITESHELGTSYGNYSAINPSTISWARQIAPSMMETLENHQKNINQSIKKEIVHSQFGPHDDH